MICLILRVCLFSMLGILGSSCITRTAFIARQKMRIRTQCPREARTVCTRFVRTQRTRLMHVSRCIEEVQLHCSLRHYCTIVCDERNFRMRYSQCMKRCKKLRKDRLRHALQKALRKHCVQPPRAPCIQHVRSRLFTRAIQDVQSDSSIQE